jgi:AraC-like DNA-binding protein/catechol 2,3-dioxygenase-like lactoylglutathione lyase family enzyme
METGGDGFTLVPDGCLDLLWLGSGRFVICGPETSGWRAALPPGIPAVGVRFAPGVAPSALGVPAAALRDARVPMDDVWGRPATDLAERIAEAATPAARVRLLEDEVRRRLAGGPPVDPVAREIAARLAVPTARRASPGDGDGGDGPGVARMAAELGYSARQLHRRSMAAFGYGPAVLARILRLQRFIALARSGRGPLGIAALAAAAGYADGPHLARECRALAGATPSALAGPPRRRVRSVHDAAGASLHARATREMRSHAMTTATATATATLGAITIDCQDPQALAEFYLQATGWELVHSSDDYAYLAGGPIRLGFQRIAGHPRPGWPDDAKQFHLDFQVGDLAEAEARLLALGATKPEFQPGGDMAVVLSDPAGHPFCITDASW